MKTDEKVTNDKQKTVIAIYGVFHKFPGLLGVVSRQHNKSNAEQVAQLSQRPRNASCLSVVSFNSTKRRVESFIVSYVGYRFITACN